MKTIDCLFIHPDRRLSPIIPSGLLSIANFLEKNGLECEILNLYVEKNPMLYLLKYLRNHKIRVVAIDLDWNIHAYDAIETAKVVKKNSSAMVVLGGFTASYFDKEIIRSPFVDGVLSNR